MLLRSVGDARNFQASIIENQLQQLRETSGTAYPSFSAIFVVFKLQVTQLHMAMTQLFMGQDLAC